MVCFLHISELSLCRILVLLVASVINVNLPSEIKFIIPSTFYHVYLVKDGNFFHERNQYYNVITRTELEVFLDRIISWTNANVETVSFDN